MPPIKSINAPRYMVGPMGVIEAPPILTQAVPEPPKATLTFYTPDKIIGVGLFEETLFVATEHGVYLRLVDGIFHRLKFEIVEEPNE